MRKTLFDEKTPLCLPASRPDSGAGTEKRPLWEWVKS
jgi:hypothetical protein